MLSGRMPFKTKMCSIILYQHYTLVYNTLMHYGMFCQVIPMLKKAMEVLAEVKGKFWKIQIMYHAVKILNGIIHPL